MTDFSNLLFPQQTPFGSVSTFGEGSAAAELSETLAVRWNTTAAVWPAALRVIYTPVVLQRPYTVTKAGWINGSTVAGNVDAGIYDENGNRLVSTGSTAMAGASTLQTVDITDTKVGPGVVFLAMVTDSATATFIINNSINVSLSRCSGIQQQLLGAMPLPATWTPANPALAFSYDTTLL
jgi:hypothetical protein